MKILLTVLLALLVSGCSLTHGTFVLEVATTTPTMPQTTIVPLPTFEPTPTQELFVACTGTVVTDLEARANVRAYAFGPVVGVVRSGTVVTIIGKNDVWYNVIIDQLRGWVHSDLIKTFCW